MTPEQRDQFAQNVRYKRLELKMSTKELGEKLSQELPTRSSRAAESAVQRIEEYGCSSDSAYFMPLCKVLKLDPAQYGKRVKE